MASTDLQITTRPVFIPADGTLTITKVGGDTLYYGASGTYGLQRPVTASDNTGTITTSVSSTGGVWLVSAGSALVFYKNDAQDDVVQTAEIEDSAVSTVKIADDAVTNAKIGAGAVDTTELAADAVTGAKIEDDAVDSEHLAAGSIDTEHLSTALGGTTAYVDLSAPDLADDDRFLLDVDMQATAYTLDNTTLPAGNPPRNVTITHTSGDTTDTLGDAVVDGTDVNDAVIQETITLSADGVATGTKAFKTVTQVVTASWVIDAVEATADNIKVGFGNLLGLDRTLSATSDVALTTLGTAIVSPTVAVDATDVESNTVDISSGTYDGSKAAKAFVTP